MAESGSMEIDWKSVDKILVVRLRSIGDTVLSTPFLILLRDFLPEARIDILLEDWVGPVLEGFEPVNEVLTVSQSFSDRISTAFRIRRNRYDAVFNLHGGTTSAFLVFASGASFRIGYRNYRFRGLYTHAYPPATDFWGRSKTHSAEQQAALLGFSGVPVKDCPKSSLPIQAGAIELVDQRLQSIFGGPVLPNFAMIHPSAAYDTKRWDTSGYAEVVRHLLARKFEIVLVTTEAETRLVGEIETECGRQLPSFSNLSLPEVTALASKATLFVGNDSGIAHIAAAVGVASVVIFGSSNVVHWRPWTDAPHRVVLNHFECQPCPGDYCREFGEPKCILSVEPGQVIEAINALIQGG